ncbi:hypothetical protein L7F22_029213 [Adiantum nelumboides]|nr:hypothetical protein [Adiantum nelumboides]
MGVLSNRVSQEELHPGDHIYSWCVAYSGIGYGKVIHFTRGQGNGVLLSCLDCFICGFPLCSFEYGENTVVFLTKAQGGTCTLTLSDPPKVVLHCAKYLLENGFGGYHIFRKNCEDSAMYCKTRLLIVAGNTIGTSEQASSFLGAPLVSVASSPLSFIMVEPWGLVAMCACMLYVSRYVSNLGNRRVLQKLLWRTRLQELQTLH